jgi:hypothetical protein
MNVLKLCMLGILLLLAGCATWDWEAASAYAASPQYQAYVSNLIQQQTVNQQLANQQNYENSMAMLNQATPTHTPNRTSRRRRSVTPGWHAGSTQSRIRSAT